MHDTAVSEFKISVKQHHTKIARKHMCLAQKRKHMTRRTRKTKNKRPRASQRKQREYDLIIKYIYICCMLRTVCSAECEHDCCRLWFFSRVVEASAGWCRIYFEYKCNGSNVCWTLTCTARQSDIFAQHNRQQNISIPFYTVICMESHSSTLLLLVVPSYAYAVHSPVMCVWGIYLSLTPSTPPTAPTPFANDVARCCCCWCYCLRLGWNGGVGWCAKYDISFAFADARRVRCVCTLHAAAARSVWGWWWSIIIAHYYYHHRCRKNGFYNIVAMFAGWQGNVREIFQWCGRILVLERLGNSGVGFGSENAVIWWFVERRLSNVISLNAEYTECSTTLP